MHIDRDSLTDTQRRAIDLYHLALAAQRQALALPPKDETFLTMVEDPATAPHDQD